MLLDELLRYDPEHLGPDLTDGVYAPVAVENVVLARVHGLVERVGEVPDTLGRVGGPSAHREGFVDLLGAGRGGEEVSPSLTHTAGLTETKAAGVGGATGETS